VRFFILFIKGYDIFILDIATETFYTLFHAFFATIANQVTDGEVFIQLRFHVHITTIYGRIVFFYIEQQHILLHLDSPYYGIDCPIAAHGAIAVEQADILGIV
jgi:hypothetical protein